MSTSTKKRAGRASEVRELTGMYELLDTVELLVSAAEPALKAELTRVFNEYSHDFPEEYFWATGPQSPALLNSLLFALMPPLCPACADKASEARP